MHKLLLKMSPDLASSCAIQKLKLKSNCLPVIWAICAALIALLQQVPNATTHSVGEPNHKHSMAANSARSFKFHNGQQQQQQSSDSATKRSDTLPPQTNGPQSDRKAFAIELLKMLHEQYGKEQGQKMEDRQSVSIGSPMMMQLMEALGADGDIKRLIDWVQNSFNLASVGEVATQFVVSKLSAVNCPAILRADREEPLVPRFLLFNEHYVDVPFELSINPSMDECLTSAKFGPARKTMILIHGYLAGYTLVDGVTNIKNRILDLNKLAHQRAIDTFIDASNSNEIGPNGTTNYVFTEDLNAKIRSQLYNVIIIDWFNGANPSPRANYIRAAVNSQVVGKLIARFLSALVVRCGTPASNLHIVAHSLGCHVSGFTGKAMSAAGHRIGRITHLDPVGLCFGRLFSKPHYRLSPDDAFDTQAVHTSLNIFDNPLDGVYNNFLVNGGRDQLGCGGQSELKNSTTSSISLLFDPAAKFAPCSHMRALALLEDDHSSELGQCQYVGYRCSSYERFLAGKCGFCDSTNSQCQLMGFAPLAMHLRKTSVANLPVPPSLLHTVAPSPYAAHYNHHLANLPLGSLDLYSSASLSSGSDTIGSAASAYPVRANASSQVTVLQQAAESVLHQAPSKATNGLQGGRVITGSPTANIILPSDMFGAPAYIVGGNELSRRADRRLAKDQGARIAQALGKLRTETRSVLAEGLTNLRGGILDHLSASSSSASKMSELEYSVSSADEQHADAATTTTVSLPITTTGLLTPTTLDTAGEMAGGTSTIAARINITSHHELDAQRSHADQISDQVPIGGQRIPAGSLNMPLFYLGTGGVSPYCVNYYQLRILIAESRLMRVLSSQGLASNRLAPQLSQHNGGLVSAAATMQLRAKTASGRNMLHLTVKLTDAFGHFFKGLSLLEHAHMLNRVANDLAPQQTILPTSQFSAAGPKEPLIEITMLLNSTRQEPIKVAESIISYYFHPIVLADRIEVNYMSNISPDVRAKYSSLLCPVAINDRHQLVRYIECHKVAAAAVVGVRK